MQAGVNPKRLRYIKTQESFSWIHGYFATEHFNKKTKGTAWPSR